MPQLRNTCYELIIDINYYLIHNVFSPVLKSLPFYYDALAVLAVIRNFFAIFMALYYPDNGAVSADVELQAIKNSDPSLYLYIRSKRHLNPRLLIIHIILYEKKSCCLPRKKSNENKRDTHLQVLLEFVI